MMFYILNDFSDDEIESITENIPDCFKNVKACRPCRYDAYVL